MTGTEESGEWYTPMPEVEFLLLDEAGKVIDGEGVGIALTHSPAIMAGYLDDRKNDEFFFEVNGKLYGNNDDIFMMKTDSNGKKWFKPLGRKNRLTYFVDEEGKAVYGLLVDDFLADSEHTNKYIHRAQVVVPDDNAQTLAAHIELKAEYRNDEENTIKKIALACAKNLDENLVPSEFEVWEIMPHSSSRGKIDLEALSGKSKRKLNNIYRF
jgi:acyl-CoA synthetase (AMP-forming)/AMP-acid ligase II